MLRRDNIVDFRGDGAHDLVISDTPKQNHRGGTWHAFDPGTLPYCGEVNPMIGLPTLAYAALSKIVYHDEISEYGGFTRQALYSDKSASMRRFIGVPGLDGWNIY